MHEENVPVDTGANEEVEFVPQSVVDGGRDFRVEGNDVSGYLGVDPEYMTYANETEKPHLTDQERYDYTNQYDHLEGNLDEETPEAEGKDREASASGQKSQVRSEESQSETVGSEAQVKFNPFS